MNARKLKLMGFTWYHLFFSAIFMSFAIVIFSEFAFAGNNAGALFFEWPDTGQEKCYDLEREINCPSEGEPFYGQDAQYQGPQRRYTKLATGARALPDDATPDDGWIMTRDNVTGLIWEIKTTDGSIHDKDKSFTWCDTNPDTNGGDQGECGDGTDTEDFINALNAANFGGFSNWRIPTVKELSSLINSTVQQNSPTIDIKYFPNTQDAYWSSTTHVNFIQAAWTPSFSTGELDHSNKSIKFSVRAVCNGNYGK